MQVDLRTRDARCGRVGDGLKWTRDGQRFVAPHHVRDLGSAAHGIPMGFAIIQVVHSVRVATELYPSDIDQARIGNREGGRGKRKRLLQCASEAVGKVSPKSR